LRFLIFQKTMQNNPSNQCVLSPEEIEFRLEAAERAWGKKNDPAPWLALAKEVLSSQMNEQFWTMTAIAAARCRDEKFWILKKAAERIALNDVRIPDPRKVGKPGWSILHTSLIYDNAPDRLGFLLESGCDPRQVDEHRRSALILVAEKGLAGNRKNLEILIPLSDLELKAKSGDTALMASVKTADWGAVRALLAAGANPKIIDGYGNTVLIAAVNSLLPDDEPGPDDIKMFVELSRLCDWKATNKKGETFIDVIRHEGAWAAVDEIASENGPEVVEWIQKTVMRRLLPKAAVIADAQAEARELRQSMSDAQTESLRRALNESEKNEGEAGPREVPRL